MAINTVLIDAGPLIALFDKSDSYHKKVISFLKNGSYKFLSTIAIVTEVSYMLGFNIHAQTDFLQWVYKKGVLLCAITQSDFPRITELMAKYSDLPMDFADASLVVAAEKSCIRKIISVDSDFDIYRLPGKEMIENIFFKEP